MSGDLEGSGLDRQVRYHDHSLELVDVADRNGLDIDTPFIELLTTAIAGGGGGLSTAQANALIDTALADSSKTASAVLFLDRDASDNGAALQAAIDGLGEEGGTVDVRGLPKTGAVFSDPFPIEQALVVKRGVHVKGPKGMVLQPTVSMPRFARFESESGWKGMEVDHDGRATSYVFEVAPLTTETVSNVDIRDVEMSNSATGAGDPFALRLVGENLSADRVRLNSPFWALATVSDHPTDAAYSKDIAIRECHGEDFSRAAIQLQGVDGCVVDDNSLLRHKTSVVGGHMIQTEPDVAKPCRNVKVRGNHVAGVPGISHQTGVANGASGDLIAMKHVDGLEISGNIAEDSGEIGITAVLGCSRIAVFGNHVERCDLVGINIGDSAVDGTYGVGKAGAVHANTVVDHSLNFSGDRPATGPDWALAGIYVGTFDDLAVFGNASTTTATSESSGIYVGTAAHDAVLANRLAVFGNTSQGETVAFNASEGVDFTRADVGSPDSGAPAVRCVIQSNGTLRAGSVGVASVTRVAAGDYQVDLLTASDSTYEPLAVIAFENNATIVNAYYNNTSQIRVLTHDAAGVKTDRWFSLVAY